MPKKTIIILFYVLCVIISLITKVYSQSTMPLPFVPKARNQQFRNEIIHYIRDIATQKNNTGSFDTLKNLDTQWNNFYQKTDWSVTITLYFHGEAIGQGQAHGPHLTDSLKLAVEQTLNNKAGHLSQSQLREARFKVNFDFYPARSYSFIEYQDRGRELSGNRIVVRELTTDLINEQLKKSQAYLLRVMHPVHHGFFKFYNAELDTREPLLRTIYTSSSLYTLFKLYSLTQDAALKQLFQPIAAFILSRQVQEGPNAGGFYYGFDSQTHKTPCVVVVGTTSKTIFTLLELNRIYPSNSSYLTAAKKAGDWLLTMIDSTGKVTTIASCSKEEWHYNKKQSFLYSGQVLSALSRLYATTHEQRYYQGAAKIAQSFLNDIKQQGPLVGDDYRPANSISSSWIMMSLIDFSNINQDAVYINTIEKIANTLLSRQISNKDDVFSNGRYLDAMTTSGNGWINEVMGVWYGVCKSHSRLTCEPYRLSIILTSRWLLQNMYTEENTYNIKNPKMAIGGLITNFTNKTVRTDAVCHGVNSLIMLLAIIPPDTSQLLTLKERPLREILPLLRAGNAFIS